MKGQKKHYQKQFFTKKSEGWFIYQRQYQNGFWTSFRFMARISKHNRQNPPVTGKSLPEALLFAEHWENMMCTKIVLNVRKDFFTQHVLPKFELGIFMY